ncbi:MAG: FtsX-like permease family protein [Candidatus Thorarchaeota archaeon]
MALLGYSDGQKRQRRLITLFCFMITSSIFMSTLVFVDSYSLYRWNEDVNVGPAAIIVSGQGYMENQVAKIANVEGITKAARLNGAFFNIESMYKHLKWSQGLEAVVYNEAFQAAFPSIFSFIEGRAPENENEVAVSMLAVNLLYLELNSPVNYSIDFTESSTNAIVVGIYDHGSLNTSQTWMYRRGDFMIHSSFYTTYTFDLVYADIDRSRITPTNPKGALMFLNEVEVAIYDIDPSYKFTGRSRYTVFNSLVMGIEDYDEYLGNLRFTQLYRTGGLLLLGFSTIYLAINYVLKQRAFETNMLIARGASIRRTRFMVSIELVISSILAAPVGILFGIIMSRVAMSATGYLQFDFSRILTQPILISIETILYSILIGIGAPLILLISQETERSRYSTSEAKPSKFARIVESLNFISSDAVLLAFSVLLLAALNSGGTIVAANPVFSAMIVLLPFALFFSLTSILLKALRRGTLYVSRAFSKIFGKIPSAVGIRKIEKQSSTSLLLVIVLVLAMSLSWNYAINSATLPTTRLNQTRFAVGGDIAFHLDSDATEMWDDFIGNASFLEASSVGSLVTEFPLSLSSGTEGLYDFVCIQPEEYLKVGYDSQGSELNSSVISDYLIQLQMTEDGAIITQDIAESYGLTAGSVLRAFWQNRSETETIEFSIIGVVDAIPDSLTFSQGYNPYPGLSWTYQVGASRIWVNQNFMEAIIDSIPDINYVYCMRMPKGTNTSLFVSQLLEIEASEAILNDEWVSAELEVEKYLSQESYELDRASDSLFTILSITTIFGTFTVYSFEGIRSRRREIALLRSLGADTSLVLKTQVSEMTVLTLMSILLLLIFSPILAVNTLISAVRTYGGVSYIFPSVLSVVFPWPLLFSILSFFIGCVVIFIFFIAFLGAKISLSETLNYTWTEAGPYTEEVY